MHRFWYSLLRGTLGLEGKSERSLAKGCVGGTIGRLIMMLSPQGCLSTEKGRLKVRQVVPKGDAICPTALLRENNTRTGIPCLAII